MSSPLRKTIYTGTFIHTPTLGKLEIIENGAIGVDESGIIRFVENVPGNGDLDVVAKRAAKGHGWADGVDVVACGGGRSTFWFPGFVGRS